MNLQNKTRYEWVIETIDGEDIVEVDHRSKLVGLKLEANQRVGLVRDFGNDSDGVVERLWAYPVYEELPKTFSDAWENDAGIAVPKKFHSEYGKWVVTHRSPYWEKRS